MVLWNIEEVSRVTQLSEEMILDNEKLGLFPARANDWGWDHKDVEKWLDSMPSPQELALEDEKDIYIFIPSRLPLNVSYGFLAFVLTAGAIIGFAIHEFFFN